MSNSRIIGSTLIVAGTALGAGMLALPMVSAATGFITSFILLLIIWALMTYTALLILEVNLAFEPYRNNFTTMAAATLGPAGKLVTWLGFLLLLYSLTAAYIAGDSSLLTVLLNQEFSLKIPTWISATLFTVVFGTVVFWSTKAVDILNRGLITIKGLFVILAVVFLMPRVNFSNLARSFQSVKYVWASVPIFLCSFGFHHVIPSLTNYLGKKPKVLKKVIVWGITIPLFLYSCWLFATFGIIPLTGTHSFLGLAKSQGSVGEFINHLILLSHNKNIKILVNGFSNVAMTTSFLGVTLGLFDFLADAFKRVNTRVGRGQTALLTFVIPLLFAVFYSHGFVIALGYAAIFVAILEIILPALMVLKLRKSNALISLYRVQGGKWTLVVTMCVGLVIIGLEIANNLHMLPTL